MRVNLTIMSGHKCTRCRFYDTKVYTVSTDGTKIYVPICTAKSKKGRIITFAYRYTRQDRPRWCPLEQGGKEGIISQSGKQEGDNGR